jgi:hypothetical protein
MNANEKNAKPLRTFQPEFVLFAFVVLAAPYDLTLLLHYSRSLAFIGGSTISARG